MSGNTSTETVRDAMTPKPTVVPKEATAMEAARTLATDNVGSLPVVQGDELVGIVTDRDLVVRVLAKDLDPHKVPVADVCTESPVVAAPDDPLGTALRRMAEGPVRRAPAAREGRLGGVA